MKQLSNRIQQSMWSADFGFIFQCLQRWMKQFINDAMNRLFDGGSL